MISVRLSFPNSHSSSYLSVRRTSHSFLPCIPFAISSAISRFLICLPVISSDSHVTYITFSPITLISPTVFFTFIVFPTTFFAILMTHPNLPLLHSLSCVPSSISIAPSVVIHQYRHPSSLSLFSIALPYSFHPHNCRGIRTAKTFVKAGFHASHIIKLQRA